MIVMLLVPSNGHAWEACAQKVMDRIVARVEEEIILQSDVEQLARIRCLVDGKAESEAAILDRLIDQWIVRKEAEASRFPAASDVDVERGMQRLMRSFVNPGNCSDSLRHNDLSDVCSLNPAFVRCASESSGFANDRISPLHFHVPHLRQTLPETARPRLLSAQSIDRLNGPVLPPSLSAFPSTSI